MKLRIIVYLFLLLSNSLYSQVYYRVYLKNKNNTEYNPYQYLHPNAIERRIINGLDLFDSSDFPINEFYLDEIVLLSDSLRGISRWMNAVFVDASLENIKKISNLSFVKKIEKVEKEPFHNICDFNLNITDTSLHEFKLQLATAQTARLGSNALADSNLNGKGVIICIIDVGFKGYKSNPALQHIFDRKGIIASYDFIKKCEYKNGGMSHGSSVFTCIAGKTAACNFGLATEADFLIARTENFMEFIREEENWLMAAEWADKHGADIINSSLGYTTHRYLPENMDGKTAFVSKAAQIASEKGILVVSSAGNEGESKWKKITAPGDAEGVLTVGAISPKTGIHIGFSSFGPSADKRIKPEVTAFGKATTWSKFGFTFLEGTSFSSPLVAGFAACTKQKFPHLTNKELKKLIIKSSDLYPYYDYAHGYGVPSANMLFNTEIAVDTTFKIEIDSFGITIFSIKTDSTIKVSELTKKEKYKTHIPDYVFYNITNSKGNICKYYVYNPQNTENAYVYIEKSEFEKPFIINVFYKKYYRQIRIDK